MKVIVIGGGASGMLAAAAAAEGGNAVDLLEQNEKLGKKIYITGKGRCNCTNAIPIRDFFPNYISNPKFLYGAFSRFDNEDLTDLLEREGTPVKTERGNRVFPVSDHASDVTRALQRYMKDGGVHVHLGTRVKEILVAEDQVSGVLLEDGTRMAADAVIVCTGGLSYPTTGSTGDGYRFARSLGHHVTELRPSLVPLLAADGDIRTLEGLSLKNVEFSVRSSKKTIFSERGEMMFTKNGVTGPLVLTASAVCGKALEKEGRLHGRIDLKPALSDEQLDQRILRDLRDNENREIKTILHGLLPGRMISPVLSRASLSGEKKGNAITREDRHRLVDTLKRFSLTLTGTAGFSQAVVTQGGVSVREISPKTMESKIVKGLYFAGEVIDVDGKTGGFNLQEAFSTGFLAGKSVRKEQ